MEKLGAQLVKRTPTAFLQGVIVLFGAAVLAFLLFEPHFEGRNAKATVFEVYFKDPFLAFVYVASIPFFFALYQGFKVLGFVGQSRLFSQESVRAIGMIKWCAIAIIGFILVSVVFLAVGDPEDRPPGVMMRVVVLFATVVVAAAAATIQRTLQNAVDLKSENDLTV